MKTVTAQQIAGKRVLLRLDTDVPLKDGKIQDVTRLKAGMETLLLCLDNAKSTIVMGHIGRPGGQEVPELSIKPMAEWIENYLKDQGRGTLKEDQLHILENLRFNEGEDKSYAEFAMELAQIGDIFINESFAAHHESASTTLLPGLLPSYAGIRFAKEVETLLGVRNTPKKPLVAIVGGVKTEDKYPAVVRFSQFCDAVLVGGLLAKKIKEENLTIASNVMLAKLTEDQLDIAPETVDSFGGIIRNAKQIVWAGPLGKFEDEEHNKGTLGVSKYVLESGAETIIGGGDTTSALKFYIDKFSFVSTGGGAMLDLLLTGSIPSLDALNNSKT